MLLIGDSIWIYLNTAHTPTNTFLANMQTINKSPHPPGFQTGVIWVNHHYSIIFTHPYQPFQHRDCTLPISDHHPTLLSISIPTKNHKLYKVEFCCTTRDSKAGFVFKLNCINWNEHFSSQDVNVSWNIFTERSQEI